MKASGFDMASGSFMSVSGVNGACTLADFSVQGYEAPVWDDDEEDYVGGCPCGRFGCPGGCFCPDAQPDPGYAGFPPPTD